MKIVDFMEGKHWIIAFIIFISLYHLYTFFTSPLRNKINNWQKGDKEVLVEKCIKNAMETSNSHPWLTSEYCECSIGEIQEKFTKSQYLEVSKESAENQFSKLYPSISDCAEKLKEEIRLKEMKNKS